MNAKQLTAYSSAAAIFLLLANKGNAQVVYHNIDPDIILTETDSVEIDFNDDGVIDLQINLDLYKWSFVTGSGWDSWHARETISIKNFESAVSAEYASFYYDVKNLNSGAAIGNYAPWNNLEVIKLMYIYRDASMTYQIPDDFFVRYENWFDNNQCLGIKFLIDGNYHYGWVRLSINDFSNAYGVIPKLVIQDFAYEATPGATIIIDNPTASIAEDLILSDVTDLQNASDFSLNFKKADHEETLSSYRIFLYEHDYYSNIPPSAAFLETLPAERYVEISELGLINYEIVFPAVFNDVNGEAIISGHTYKAIILSIADGILTTKNNVSLPSNFQKNIGVKTQAPTLLDIVEHTDNCNISDFKINFNRSSNESVIDEYRIYILNHNYYFEYGLENILLGLDSSYYLSVPPDNSENYSVFLDLNKKVVIDEDPILYQKYYVAVVTVADSLNASIADIATTRYYESYYGQELGIEAEFYCTTYPIVSIVEIAGTSKTAGDILVQLDGPDNKSGLARYWMYIVPAEEKNDFNKTKALAVLPFNFLGKGPDTSLYAFFQENINDINGMPVTIEKDYVVFVALVSNNNPSVISLSLPSIPFNLLEGDNAINNNFYISDNILHIRSFEDLPFDLKIYSTTGELVAEFEVTSRDTAIDLNQLPKGIYIINSTSNRNIPSTKIFIGHAGY